MVAIVKLAWSFHLNLRSKARSSKMQHLTSCTFLFVFSYSRYILRVSCKKNDRLFSATWRISSQFYFQRAFHVVSSHPLIICPYFLSIRLVVDFYSKNRLCEALFIALTFALFLISENCCTSLRVIAIKFYAFE